MQIFVALKLQLQNHKCKPGAIFSAICRRDIAGVSNMFETWCNFSATKIASSYRDKYRLCKRAFRGEKLFKPHAQNMIMKVESSKFSMSTLFLLYGSPLGARRWRGFNVGKTIFWYVIYVHIKTTSPTCWLLWIENESHLFVPHVSSAANRMHKLIEIYCSCLMWSRETLPQPQQLSS